VKKVQNYSQPFSTRRYHNLEEGIKKCDFWPISLYRCNDTNYKIWLNYNGRQKRTRMSQM